MRTHAALITALILSSSLFAADAETSKYTLTVNGSGKAKVRATVADVQLAVKVDGRSALEVQQMLARLSTPVIDAVKRLNGTQVEAGAMTIYPQYAKENPNLVVGYQGQNSISFSAPVDRAGEVIDAAIAAGANQLQNVSVRPEDDAVATAREQALKEASAEALREAKAVMEALGLKRRGIVNVSINPSDNYIHPQRFYKAMAVASTESTQVLEEEQDVNATVMVELSFEP